MLRPLRVALLLVFALPVAAEERAVQLLLPSQRLQPTSTFEVRFAAEMVRPDQLGKPAADSPSRKIRKGRSRHSFEPLDSAGGYRCGAGELEK